MRSTTVTESRTAADALGGIPYVLIRKPIRNMYLRMRDDGTVVVTAGRHFTGAQADRFVLANRSFVERAGRKRADEARLRETEENLHFVTGERVLLYGEQVPFFLTEGHPASVFFSEAKVVMTAPASWTEEQRRKLFLREKKKYTEEVLTEICRRTQPLFAPWGVPFPKLSFRKMKSRWGSCRAASAAITLNLQLIEKPMPAIEYVVLHEFSHFLHQDHSPAFYAVVQHFMPDYKARRKLLK